MGKVDSIYSYVSEFIHTKTSTEKNCTHWNPETQLTPETRTAERDFSQH